MALRIIQLITPNNQSIKIDLNGEENELIDLISMICGIPENNIKGLKDCYGNYYTISSAINNPQLNSEYSDVYFLVCPPTTDNRQISQTQLTNLNCTPVACKSKSFKQNYGSFHRNPRKYTKNEENFEKNDQKFTNFYQLRNLQERPVRNFHELNDENLNEKIRGRNPLGNNYETDLLENDEINNRFNINEDNRIISDFNSNFEQQKGIPSEVKKIMKEIQKAKILSEFQINSIIKLIIHDNQEVLNLIKLYSQEIIDKNSLKSGLDRIMNKLKNNKLNLESNSTIREKLYYILERLESSHLLEDLDDVNILKNLIEWENINVIKAYEIYESEGDFDNLKDSLIEIIKTRKNLGNKRQFNFDVIKTKQTIISNKHKNNNINLILDKKIEEKILAKLHTEEKIIFKFAIRNNFRELQILSELYEAFKNEEILIKPIKLMSKRFIEENVTQNMSEGKKCVFSDFLAARNPNLIEIFKEFKEHYRIEKLKTDVSAFISKQGSPSSISTSKASNNKTVKKLPSSSENSDDENSLLENNSKKTKYETTTNSFGEFINLVNVMNFLKPEEKKEFEISVKKNSPSAIKLVNDYYKNKNILSIKSSLLSMFRNNKNQINNSIPSGLEKTEKDREREKERENSKNTLTQSKNNSKSSDSIHKYNSLEKIINNLNKSEKISSEQHKFLLNKFENHDEKINSVWEVYKHNNNMNDLIESLMILSKNSKKTNKTKSLKNLEVQTKSSKEIDFSLRNRKSIEEKDETKMKQLNVIKVLEKENLIDKEKVKTIHQLIEEENHLLISAFEVLSVTKDPKEFCETLSMICENYKNNNQNKKEVNTKSNQNTIDNKDVRLTQIFREFMTNTKYFNDNEKNTLSKLFSNKNEFILSALELYEKENDDVDFLDSLQIALKKIKY